MTVKKTDWLWDRNIPPIKVKNILTDERHPKFTELAALLLARKNTPKEVFKNYLSRDTFFRNWQRIKKKMRQDKWTEDRIIFWQAVYEKLAEIFREDAIRPLRQFPGEMNCSGCGRADQKFAQTSRFNTKRSGPKARRVPTGHFTR